MQVTFYLEIIVTCLKDATKYIFTHNLFFPILIDVVIFQLGLNYLNALDDNCLTLLFISRPHWMLCSDWSEGID